MTAPVAATPPVVLTSQSPASDGDATSAAPFASALDGALNAGRGPVTGRGAEHRAPGHGPRDDSAPGQRTHQPAGVRHHGRDRDDDRPQRDDPSIQDAAPAGTDPAGTASAPPLLPAAVPPLWTLALAAAAPADGGTTDPAPAVDAVAGAAVPVPPVIPAGGAPLPAVDLAGTEPAPAGLPGIPSAASDVALAAPDAASVSADTPTAPADPGLPPGTATPVVPATLAPASAAAAVPVATSSAPADQSVAAADVTAAAGTPAPADPAALAGLAITGDAHSPIRAEATAGPIPDAGTDADAIASPPAAGPAPVPATGAADSSSADTGDAPSQDQGPATPDATVSVQPALQAAPVTPTAAPTAAAPAVSQPVATQVAQHVAVLGRGPDGTSSVTVVLHPDSLGPVQVEVTVNRGTIDLTMRGAHEQGRAALMQALPDLRRDLESAGLTCSRLDVDRDTGGSWSAQHQAGQQPSPDGRGRQPARPEPRAYAWGRPDDLHGGRPATPSTRSTSSGVDVRV